jgi:6-phosphogluconolactonase (cycloisomerase 2 family)
MGIGHLFGWGHRLHVGRERNVKSRRVTAKPLRLEPLEKRQMLAVSPMGEIRGAAWNDVDGNGLWDSGEPVLPGVTIQLDTDGDGVWDNSTMTAGDGTYSFTELASGVYTLGENVPAGFEQTFPLHFPGSGQLTFQESIADKTEGMTLAAVSPDGKFVYGANGGSDSITTFSINESTGQFSEVSIAQDGVDGVDGLDGVHHLALSPDGKHLYATGEWDDALVVFSRDETTGELTFVETLRDGADGIDGLDRTEWVTVSPDGKNVYATGRNDDALLVFNRDASTGQLTFVELHQDGVNGIEGLDAARTVTISPDGNHVYVTGVEDNALNVFARDAATGQLTLVETLRDNGDGVDGLAQPQEVTVSPDGNHVYVAGWGDNALSVFSRDTATGALTFVEIQQNGTDGVDGLSGAISVTVSPDGAHVYATGWWNDGVAVFGRDVATGELSFIEMIRNRVDAPELDTARSVVVTPNGKYVYVAARRDDSLVAFRRDTSTGCLTFLVAQSYNDSQPDSLEGPTSATVSPDGRHVYTTAADDDALSVFRRDPETGELAFIQAHKDSGDLGLDGAESAVVSPDGKHVYAVGFYDDAVNVFSRNEMTGWLTFVEVHRDGVDGVDGLNAAQSVVLSPDG